MAKVVSFISFNGGAGTTTLCVETAASLTGYFNARVLLIDLDPRMHPLLDA
jgi:cellulose biosynthesis protein BcsQ